MSIWIYWSMAIAAALTPLYLVWAKYRYKRVRASIVTWLKTHPGWHYPPEIREATHTGRGLLFMLLGDLECDGQVESMRGEPPYPGAKHFRLLYRASPDS
jgi:hypothetical protein